MEINTPRSAPPRGVDEGNAKADPLNENLRILTWTAPDMAMFESSQKMKETIQSSRESALATSGRPANRDFSAGLAFGLRDSGRSFLSATPRATVACIW